MRLSTRARYALRSMVEIDRATRDGRPVSLASVSRCTNISRRYLEQLAPTLRAARLLRGVRGRAGGYLLARAAAEIPVGQIIEAVAGPVSIVRCVARPECCLLADICSCRRVYTAINTRLVEALQSFSLADIASGDWAESSAAATPATPATPGTAALAASATGPRIKPPC